MNSNQTPPDLYFENYFFSRNSHLQPHLQVFMRNLHTELHHRGTAAFRPRKYWGERGM